MNGYLFDPYAEGDLLGKIVNIFKEPQRLERITQGARTTKIETMEDHVDKICQFYTRAIQNEKGAWGRLDTNGREGYVKN